MNVEVTIMIHFTVCSFSSNEELQNFIINFPFLIIYVLFDPIPILYLLI